MSSVVCSLPKWDLPFGRRHPEWGVFFNAAFWQWQPKESARLGWRRDLLATHTNPHGPEASHVGHVSWLVRPEPGKERPEDCLWAQRVPPVGWLNVWVSPSGWAEPIPALAEAQ